MKPDDQPGEFLTTKQVAAVLACSDDVVLAAIRRGHLPAMKYGRLVRIARSDLDDFIASHMTKPDGTQRARPGRRG